MLRLMGALSLALGAAAAGCGDDSTTAGAGGIGGNGGTGGTMVFEPGPTCTAFCAKAVGECGAFLFTEAECRQGCEESIFTEGQSSEACGDAVEAVFACAAELECQEVYDWRDREPPNAYPCFDAVSVVGTVCP